MPVDGKSKKFKKRNIKKIPTQPGIYSLHKNGKVIYYGMSETSVHDRLSRHKSGEEGTCTQSATHFKVELASNPSDREEELLANFNENHGKLPKCNTRK